MELLSLLLGGGGLGAILGFAKPIIGFFQDRSDKAHELNMLSALTDSQVRLAGVQLQSAAVDAEIRDIESAREEQMTSMKNAGRFINNFNAAIRPGHMTAFTVMYLTYKGVVLYFTTTNSGWNFDTVGVFWTEYDMQIYSNMLFFYFTSRVFVRKSN